MKIEQLLDEYFKEFTQGSEGKLHANLYDFYLWLKERNGS